MFHIPFSQKDNISKKENEFEFEKFENIIAINIVINESIIAIVKGDGKNLLKKFSIYFVKQNIKREGHHALFHQYLK